MRRKCRELNASCKEFPKAGPNFALSESISGQHVRPITCRNYNIMTYVHSHIHMCVYIHDMLQVHWSKLVIIESVDQTLVKAPVFFSFFIIPTPCPSDWPDVRFSSAAISLSNNFLWNVCMRVCMYVFLWTTEEDGIRQNFDESWSFN